MKNERTLSYSMSQKLSAEDLKNVSAAGQTSYATANGSYSHGVWDTSIDITWDL